MGDRKLTVVAPVWPNASELWMHRMTKLLAEETCAFATFSPCERSIAGKVPTYDLLPVWAQPLRRWNVTNVGFGIGSSRMAGLLRKTQSTHILCHYATTAIHFRDVWPKSTVPIWVHCHGYDVTWSRRRLAGLPMHRYLDELRWLADKAMLIANSKFTQQRLVEIGVPSDRIVVKYIGIPIHESIVESQPSRSTVNFLFLGRLIDFKGPVETIRAFELAMKSGKLDGRLTIAGAGPLESLCRDIVANSIYRDKIELVGAVSAERGEQLRRQADVFTAHSRLGNTTGQAEAFGVAFVEAMADGLPIVTGEYGGVCESIVDGETGYFFKPGDIEEHARLLLQLASDASLRKRLGEAGRARAKKFFSLEAESQALRRILFNE